MDAGRLLYRAVSVGVASDRLWQLLETTGIAVFVGANGSGKSLAAVHSRLGVLRGRQWACLDLDHAHHRDFRQHAEGCAVCADALPAVRRLTELAEVDAAELLCAEGLDALASGHTGQRLVYSTVELLDDDGLPHPLYRPLVDYPRLTRVEHADVFMDEVAGVSDASESSSIPVQVVNWLHQLRKRDVRLVVTTPAYGRCSKPIRQVAQLVVDCKSFLPERAESGRLWRPRRGFFFQAFDAREFEDFTSGTKERCKPVAKAVYWRPGGEAERRYSTLGQVLSLGHVTEAGMCSACGGTRSRPKCACPADDLGDVELRVVERVSASGVRTRSAVPADSIEGAA